MLYVDFQMPGQLIAYLSIAYAFYPVTRLFVIIVISVCAISYHFNYDDAFR